MVMSHKIFFTPFSPRKLLFSKKLLNKKIFKTSFTIRKVIFIFVARPPPSLQKRLRLQKWFFTVSSKNTGFLLFNERVTCLHFTLDMLKKRTHNCTRTHTVKHILWQTLCLVYILVKTARDKTRTRVWRAHLVFHTLGLFSSHLEALGYMPVNQSRVKGNKNVSTMGCSLSRFWGIWF